MSASNQKKLRKEQAAAYMTERQRIEAAEQKKLKRYTLTFWVVMALCVCIVVGSIAINPIKNVVYTNTEAVTIGNHTLNAVTLNYFYVDAINQWYSYYGSYASYMGMDTATALNKQYYDSDKTQTWADYFLDTAIENIKSTYAVYDMAVAAGHKLTDEEQSSINSTVTNLELYAQIYGYSGADVYLRAIYGNGATTESYRKYYEISTLADSYYTAYSEDLKDSYKPEDLRAYEADKTVEYNAYSYAYYVLSAAKFYEGGTKNDKGEITYSTEEKKAAAEKAEKIVNAIIAGDYDALEPFLNLPAADTGSKDDGTVAQADDDKDEDDKKEETREEVIQKIKDALPVKTVEDLNLIIKYLAVNKGLTSAAATEKDDVLYGSVDSTYRDWIVGKVEEEKDEKTGETEGGSTEDTENKDEAEEEEEKPTYVDRNPGDIKSFEKTTGTGDDKVVSSYTMVLFEEKSDNVYPLKNVRHILIKFQNGTYNSSTGETTYTEEQKNAAKTEAEKLLAQWKEGEMTEDSFADLATKESDDTASTGDGGLYEDVYPGQMVENFDEWCFEEGRKAGDTGIVEGTAGYHIIYFVGDSETNYRDHLVSADKLTDDMEDWHDKLIEAIKFALLSDKCVDKGMTLS